MTTITSRSRLPLIALALLAAALAPAPAARAQEIGFPKGYDTETKAWLIITAVRLDETPGRMIRDFSPAAGATVRLILPDGQIEEKPTKPFPHKDTTYQAAEFSVDFDKPCTIEMRFPDGRQARIENYRLLSSWKTHFMYHTTVGAKSPATVFRKEKAAGSDDLYCCVYGLFPCVFYKKSGGTL